MVGRELCARRRCFLKAGLDTAGGHCLAWERLLKGRRQTVGHSRKLPKRPP